MDIQSIDPETLLHMYEVAFKIRQFESKVYEVFNLNLIPGTMHLYLGEEAVATGVCGNLTNEDFLTSTHRGHGHCIAKGADVKKMMAELFGRTTGYCHGKGGSMHIADFAVGMLGANGVVGGGIPIAAGAGLTCKLKHPGRVVACFFGDGASNQGANFHEPLNLASVWKLPVIFVCENNLYAMGTPARIACSVQDIAIRATGYNIPYQIVDGMDVVAVYEAAKEAVEYCRAGNGPYFIEAKTYRMKGHSKYDPATYRPEEEVQEWLARDAIQLYRSKLIDDAGFPADQIETIESRVNQEIEDAVTWASEGPQPVIEDALKGVYLEEDN
ncbi:MAG TPA: thiamine pyrophosphate-dependent dehydrogenase E1 component subunit alpha [Candidatus Lokiarchaeia archaeon]|nr:thiamine pyrophosphate-dependent dehydrogenase E1 component subunit alpha [Candidatus Lokiarchaeia archaeon]